MTMATFSKKGIPEDLKLSTEDIMKILPHRYPMLLLDRVEELVLFESAVGIKNVTANEHFFVGHFPQHPVMPGVLVIEAMAQTAAVLAMHSLNVSYEDHVVYFMSINEARFRHPVYPGDTLRMRVCKKHRRDAVWKFYAEASIGDQLVTEGIYTAMISQRKQPVSSSSSS
jgi:3-hydroxyacyl-[acyl-carrier-protein] dehydratase